MPNSLTVLPHVPDHGAAYAGVLSRILSVREENQQTEVAKRKAAEDERTNAVKAALTAYTGQPQLLARALAALAPGDRQRAQRAGFGIVTPMESPEQVLARAQSEQKTQDATAPIPATPLQTPAVVPPSTDTPGLPTSADWAGAMGAATSAPPITAPPPTMVASANAVIDAENRHHLAVYGRELPADYVKQRYIELLQGPVGQIAANKIETKTAPTAQENIKNAADEKMFNQVTLPKSKADVANLGSEVKYRDTVQTPNTRAKTVKTQAETVKTGEEIKALRQSNDPVVKSILARSLAEGVIADPQSFHGMPMDDKRLVVNFLHRAPVKLTASETDQINTSENGLNLLRDTRAIVDKWAKRGVNITGPVLGRYEEAANKFGDGIMPPQLTPEQKTEFAQDISKMHEWLTVLPILETKALVGSRPAKEIIARVAGVTPSLSKATAFFDGAMAGTEQRLKERQQTLSGKPWGGKPPVLDGGSSGAKPLDEATARQFLQQAGGDKAKARELAKAAGYTF